jgi:hypothetical protein
MNGFLEQLVSEAKGCRNPEHGHLPIDPKWQPIPRTAGSCKWGYCTLIWIAKSVPEIASRATMSITAQRPSRRTENRVGLLAGNGIATLLASDPILKDHGTEADRK